MKITLYLKNKTIHFYQHGHLRPRQINRIKYISKFNRTNIIEFESKKEDTVFKKQNTFKKLFLFFFPLINIGIIKRKLDKNIIIYSFGKIILNKKYIIEIDNPYILTFYKLYSFRIFKKFISYLLSRKNCIEIRCISNACKKNLISELGLDLLHKTKIYYPPIALKKKIKIVNRKKIKFIFIGSQFYLKGGNYAIQAFKELQKIKPNISLTIISNVPKKFNEYYKNIQIINKDYTNQEIIKEVLPKFDILIHTSFCESFGMVIYEAIMNNLAIICNDIYASKEMVKNNYNGFLLKPFISNWNQIKPTYYFNHVKDLENEIEKNFNNSYLRNLKKKILKISDINTLNRFKRNSNKISGELNQFS